MPEHTSHPIYEALSTITPHAFHSGHGHDSVFGLTSGQIRGMAQAHYRTQNRPPSEFSSLAASLIVCLSFAARKRRALSTGIHIGILETFSVDNMAAIAGAWMTYPAANHEYLVHGVVSGRQIYRAISFQDMLDAGLDRLMPEISHASGWGAVVKSAYLFKNAMATTRSAVTSWERTPMYMLGYLPNVRLDTGHHGQPIAPRSDTTEETTTTDVSSEHPDQNSIPAYPHTVLTEEEIIIAKRIGHFHGDQFVFPVAVALLCIRARSWRYHPDGIFENELNLLMQHLSDLEVHPTLQQQACVRGEVRIEVRAYPELQQMYFLIRKFFERKGMEDAERTREAARNTDGRGQRPQTTHRVTLRTIHGQERGYLRK